MKCPEGEECPYCSLCPANLPADVFKDLHFLPDPVLDETSQKYKPFSEAYGAVTTDAHRPSAKSKVSKTDADKKNGRLFVGGKFRATTIFIWKSVETYGQTNHAVYLWVRYQCT